MDKIGNLALVAQMLDGAEKNIQSAKLLIKETLGGIGTSAARPTAGGISSMAQAVSATNLGKIIEGIFDGQNMYGPDNKLYPVPANYASKSKLVEGDGLKLTISEDGSFIYKQIAPVERKRILGTLAQDERGDYRVVAEGVSYKVLLASLTYFKAEPGDTVALEVPSATQSAWAAVVNVLKGGVAVDDGEFSKDASSYASGVHFTGTPADEEL